MRMDVLRDWLRRVVKITIVIHGALNMSHLNYRVSILRINAVYDNVQKGEKPPESIATSGAQKWLGPHESHVSALP